ncbi:MAG: dihydroorotase [Prevotella sp.]|nr:dihydroorotase [Prevotella sp.]
MRTVIDGGCIVNEGKTFTGTVILDDDRITEIQEGNNHPRGTYDRLVDATGCFVIPGVIDDHVHFREPGLTRKADIESESRAAAAGGVTSFFDMPNTVPQTTTVEAFDEKLLLGQQHSHVNYGFFFGATKDNSQLFRQLDRTRIPGIKLFMGASTGNMLVDRRESLNAVFRACTELGLPLMTHCEDTAMINKNMAEMKQRYGDDPDITLHALIRSAESCYACSSLAVELAREWGTRLHIAHVSTARELDLFEPAGPTGTLPQITGEAVISHLWFTDEDYKPLGTRIKCNPSVKTSADCDALRKALSDGRIAVVGTDHAPHELKDKQGGCAKAASGMPMLQFSLVAMLTLMDQGFVTMERLVELMAHHPAQLFSVSERGFLRQGYKADIAIVRRCDPWKVSDDGVESKCGWTPMQGQQFGWEVVKSFCNGHLVYDKGLVDDGYRGEAIRFRLDEV